MTPSLRQKRIMLLATAATVIATLVVMYLLGSLLLPIGLSAIIAYMLLPVVHLLERAMPWRRRHPLLSRITGIVIIFIAGAGVVAGVLLSVVPPTIHQAGLFVEQFPRFFSDARVTLESWLAIYSDRIPVELRHDIEKLLADVGSVLADAVWHGTLRTLNRISGSLSLIIGFATLPMLVYYLMRDSGSINPAVRSPFPVSMQPYVQDVLDIVGRTVGAYLRGQLTLALVVGTIVGVGLLLLGVPFAFFLGIVAALTELVPIIGPWIGGAVGVLVTLATVPDKAPWVILLYLVIQLAENAVLVPRIQGNALKLHPIAVIMIVVISGHYFGIWGIILGPPLVAMGKDMVVYFFQQWSLPEEQQGGIPQPEESGKV